MSVLPSVTANDTRRLSPRTILPGLTRPPIRMRVPGETCFSTTSLGELKKTIESRSAPSTNTEATARIPRLAPIRISRRCWRVISSRLTFEPQRPDHILDAAEFFRIVGQRAFGIFGRGMGPITFAEHRIGAQQTLPAFEVVSILL